MKVVTYIEASVIAGVTRQRISNIRTAIEKGESRYQFLGYSMENKKQGIDIDHPDWKHYCEKNKNHLIKKNRKKRDTEQISIDNESPKTNVNKNTSIINIFVPAVRSAVSEIFKPDQATMKRLFSAIDRNLEGKL